MRGFAAVGLHRPKSPENIGHVMRAAHCFDAAMVVIAGDRTTVRSGVDYCTNTSKAERHIPTIHSDDLHGHVPFGCVPIAVDLVDDAQPLHSFQHPRSAFYIFGPEDGTLGVEILSWCEHRVMIPTRNCMNLGMTVNVVLYGRQAKALRASRKLEIAA